jgi:hypothetical protein
LRLPSRYFFSFFPILSFATFSSLNTFDMPSETVSREQFMRELESYMDSINKPLGKIPVMGYRELDLYELFL